MCDNAPTTPSTQLPTKGAPKRRWLTRGAIALLIGYSGLATWVSYDVLMQAAKKQINHSFLSIESSLTEGPLRTCYTLTVKQAFASQAERAKVADRLFSDKTPERSDVGYCSKTGELTYSAFGGHLLTAAQAAAFIDAGKLFLANPNAHTVAAFNEAFGDAYSGVIHRKLALFAQIEENPWQDPWPPRAGKTTAK